MNNKIGLVSLGCPKALVDSERIVTQLKMDGYEIVPDYDDAGLVIVNTCGFIDSARQESLEAIGEALAQNGRVLVTGCLGAQADNISTAHPKVLGISGPQAYEQVMEQVHRHLPFEQERDPLLDLVPASGLKLTPRHYAYLKISEGCNHRCSFCIIPSMRGDLVSRPIGEVLDEAESLVNSGVRELLVISQDTSAYGLDRRYQTGFWQGQPVKGNMHGLCQALSQLGVWVRLHYVYPYPHVDQVIPLMADGQILPYLDIPFQHASARILKAMKRPAATEKTLDRIAQWRNDCPELVLRSTFIVGFPGETDEDFQELLDFLGEAQLDRVGCFKYSPVTGAAANELPGAVPEDIKQERWERFMETQQVISEQRLASRVDTEQDVLIDYRSEDGAHYVARSKADAPEIDGVVYLPYREDVAAGELVRVRITSSDEYDLYADW